MDSSCATTGSAGGFFGARALRGADSFAAAVFGFNTFVL